MKKAKKQIKIHSLDVSNESVYNESECVSERYRYSFTSSDMIFDIENFECFIITEIPETIKEFRETHNLSKSELIEWLNKNYKI